MVKAVGARHTVGGESKWEASVRPLGRGEEHKSAQRGLAVAGSKQTCSALDQVASLNGLLAAEIAAAI